MSGQRAVVRRPGRIIAQAKRTGITALLHMLKRGEVHKPGTYQAASEIWRRYRTQSRDLRHGQDLDYFIPICYAERYLRKKHHYMIFNSTALYGNTEAKRVYSWNEGTIGRMNSLLNLAGARLRFLAMTRYPFPKPIKISYEYTKVDGTTVEKNGYGYAGSKRSPKVILAHPSLQPLDFVDMIRAHVNELCRQCFILSVPHDHALKFINILIFKLRPFLDHIYTQQRMEDTTRRATNSFIRRADTILDELLVRLRADYGMRIGRVGRVTHSTSPEEKSNSTKLSIRKLIEEQLPSEERRQLLEKIDAGLITDKDAQRLIKRVLDSAASVGTRLHRRVSWGRPRPFSGRTIVYGGDYVPTDMSGYILAADVPIRSGKGIADFVLYVRTCHYIEAEGDEPAIGEHRPVMIVDLKSKIAHDFGFVGRVLKNTGRIVPDEAQSRRALTDDEWNTTLSNTPTRTESQQLDSYAQGLLEDYEILTNRAQHDVTDILQGILVCDGTESPSRIRENLKRLTVSVYEDIQSEMKERKAKTGDSESFIHPRTIYEGKYKTDVPPKMALVLKPLTLRSNVNIEDILPTPIIQTHQPTFNPFQNRIPDNRQFILYASVGGSGSADSAGWLARYWDGIDVSRRLAGNLNDSKIVWLDMAGEFTNPDIRKGFINTRTETPRLTLEYTSKSRRSDSTIRRYTRDFMKRVTFVDLSDQAFEVLFAGGRFPSKRFFKDKVRGHDLVIVSGFDTLWSMTPPELQGLFKSLQVVVAESTKSKNTTTIWFDSTVPQTSTSMIYKSHHIRPFSFDSPIQTYVDEVIINHPVPPSPGISEAAYGDHLRRVVTVTHDGKSVSSIVEIPALRGWSNRFRSESFQDISHSVFYYRGTQSSGRYLTVQDVHSRFDDQSLSDIAPWIGSLIDESDSDTLIESPKLVRFGLKKTRLSDSDKKLRYMGVLSRLRLTPELGDHRTRRASKRTSDTQYCSVSRINKRRKNWTPRLHTEPLQHVSIPPEEALLRLGKPLPEEGMRLEIDRLFHTIGAMKALFRSVFLRDFLDTILSEVTSLMKRGASDDNLVSTLQSILKRSDYSSSLWYQLRYMRLNIREWNLPRALRANLEKIAAHDEDLLRFGNYILLMFAVLDRIWSNLRETDFGLIELHKLWQSVRPWVLLQLGAVQMGRGPVSEFHAGDVLRSLINRTRNIAMKPVPNKAPFDDIRYGILCSSFEPDEAGFVNHWWVFERTQYSQDFVAGCILERDGRTNGTAIIPMDEQAESARWVLKNLLVQPVVIPKIDGITLVFGPDEDEKYSQSGIDYRSINWSPIGHMRYGTRRVGAPARLKWFRTYYYATMPTPNGSYLPARPRDLSDRMIQHLEKIAGQDEGITRAECELQPDSEEFIVKFLTREQEFIGEIRFQRLDQLISFLRTPYEVGVPLILGRKYLTWNPISDVKYHLNSDNIKTDVERNIFSSRQSGEPHQLSNDWNSVLDEDL